MAFFKRKKKSKLPDLPSFKPVTEDVSRFRPRAQKPLKKEDSGFPDLPEVKRKRTVEFPELPKLPSKYGDIDSTKIFEKDLPDYSLIDDMEEIKESVSPKQLPAEIPVRKRAPKIRTGFDEEFAGEKALFIKIKDYRRAVEMIDEIKLKISNAEETLRELEQLREKEHSEFGIWHQNIEKIKDKLILIDRILSGYQ